MSKNRDFSLYDIEEFLKAAGAERINEKAVIDLEKELEHTVKELIDEAYVYANYAGRKKLIKEEDVKLVNKRRYVPVKHKIQARINNKKDIIMLGTNL
ncbi:MAG: histone-like protein [Candidatus Micrarchaeia archaeon]